MKIGVQIFILLFMLGANLACIGKCHAQEPTIDSFPFRFYEVTGIDQNHIDNWIIAKHYQKTFYPIDIDYISKTDTSIECDSLTIFIDKRSRSVATLFTRGIISCNNFKADYQIQFDENLMPIYEGKKNLLIWRVHLLDFISTKKTCRIIKFSIFPRTIYYAELTNENAHKRTPLDKFIKNARLTWLYKSPQHVPNM